MVYNNVFNLFGKYFIRRRKNKAFTADVRIINNINSTMDNENNIEYDYRRSMCSDSDTENGFSENDLSDDNTDGKEKEISNYNRRNNGKRNINNCSICLEDISYDDNGIRNVKTNLFHCNHNDLFHYSCAWTWIVSSHTMTDENELLINCPLCRNITSFYVPEQ